MADQKSDKIALIIIDQLRRDYEPYFTKCRKLLSYCTTCDTNSIPASTEAMHTNISVGKYPVEHGVISKKSKDGRDVESLIMKYTAQTLTPLASVSFKRKHKTFFAGGKDVVADILATDMESDLRVLGKQHPGSKWMIESKNYRGSCWEKVYTSWKNTLPEYILTQEVLDDTLLKLFEGILTADKESGSKSFYILALSGLDFIGHALGPHSDEVINHIKNIDKKIADILDANKNTLFIIAGDHGCRLTDRYVIQQKQDESRPAVLYHRAGDLYTPAGSFEFDSEKNFQYLSYDGGLLRIWLRDYHNLSSRDAELLSEYGTIIDLRSGKPENVEQGFLKIIENSRHANIGDIFVVSKNDATFCKNDWVSDVMVKKKILNQKELQLYELPRGEHGTYYDSDRLTLFMSNHDFGKSMLLNLTIREEIEKLMGAV